MLLKFNKLTNLLLDLTYNNINSASSKLIIEGLS